MLYYMNNRSLSVKNSNPRNRVRKINKNVIEIISVVDSNNNTTTNTNQYNGAGSASEIPVASAVAPSLISGGNDSCLKS